jgi:hypothetical protein
MAWKERLSKSQSSGESKQHRRSRRPARQQPNQVVEANAVDKAITHRLVVRPAASGKIELPEDITAAELDSVWKQLDAIKTLIQAQVTVLSAPKEESVYGSTSEEEDGRGSGIGS